MKALHIAATGMRAQELNVEVISNNIANMRTTGYKRQRADFQDLLYQNLRRMGTNTSATGTIVPTGVQIGSGVKTASTARIMTQGNLAESGKDLDVAVRGEGFFQIHGGVVPGVLRPSPRHPGKHFRESPSPDPGFHLPESQ